MLEDRAGAFGDVAEDAGEPGPAGDSRPALEGAQQPRRRRATGAAGVREARNGVEVGGGVGGHVEHRVVGADPGRTEVPLDPAVEVLQSPDPHARRRHLVTLTRHGDLDQPLVVVAPSRPFRGPDGRGMGERGRPGVQDPGPGALLPGQRSGVLDVHAGVHHGQLAAPQHPLDVMLPEPK